jgi:hypothetical protein|nr:hypothetical protein [Thermococcus sp. EXT9]
MGDKSPKKRPIYPLDWEIKALTGFFFDSFNGFSSWWGVHPSKENGY